MKLGTKLGIVGGGCLAIVLLVVFFMNISYNNTAERIRTDVEAQYKKIEADYEKMSRIILQQAGIVHKYSKDFKDIYKGMMTGRYGKDGSKAMWQWIKEQNPQIDSTIYQKLMVTVESQRTTLSRKQEQVASMVAEYNKMLRVAPAKWFVDGTEMEAKIISSSNTKVVVETGIDDSSNNIFNQ